MAAPRCGADECELPATHVLTVKKGASVSTTKQMPYCSDHGVIACALAQQLDDVADVRLQPLEL